MIFSLDTLKQAEPYRLPGYLDDALSIGKPLGDNLYDFTFEQIQYLSKYRIKSTGLGDVVKSIIHKGLDIIPMPESTRKEIKGCSKCAERAARLNKMIPNINIFRH